MTRPIQAPLAQLRDVDEETWRQLFGVERDTHPGSDPTTQALAAALLGDLDLARTILRGGSAAIYTRNRWPELRPADGVSLREGLDGGIFAVNTWLHPDASDGKDITWLEENAEQILERLCALRDALPQRLRVPA